jgi:hypothetical protein
VNKATFGYFSSPEQTVPEYDPGMDINCLVCGQPLRSAPVRTVSLLLVGDDPQDRSQWDDRCYFYRLHQHCDNALTPEQEAALDSVIIDAVGNAKRNTN